MSSDLEQLLRRTLADRAATVTTGPEWDQTEAPARHRRRWIAPVAAAAAVAAIAVAVIAVPHGDHPRTPSATQHPTPSPSTSTTPPHVPAAPTCATALPARWVTALHNAVVSLGAAPLVDPLSVAPDGTVVALRDAGGTPGSSREVVLVPPTGAPQTAFRVSDPDRDSVQSAQLYQHWLIVAVTLRGRPPAHTVPGDSPMPNVQQLVVIDRDNGTRKTLADMSHRYIDLATVLGGRVYWDVRRSYGASTAVVKSYGLASGDTRVQYSGPAGYLTSTGVGIFDGRRTIVAPDLPATVRHAVGSAVWSVRTDGTSFAWAASRTELGWWQPGMSRPVLRSLRTPLALEDGGSFEVSGRYVIDDGGAARVIDMATGAIAPLTGARLFGGHDRGAWGLATGGGIVAGSAYFGKSGYVGNYWQDGDRALLRVDVAHLPDLRC